MKTIFKLAFVFVFAFYCGAQNNIFKASQNSNPKLIVGIVVDQMRYDYLTRFYDKYGDGGFKRMMNEGFNCKNNHFNYVPTSTGPGHASIYTGTTPKYHGVIGNDWYDKELKSMVYCVEDDSVQSIGAETSDGQMSPHRMKTTTFGDENRLFTQMRGKTIGISIKNRGAILPAGHTANAAYWFDYEHEGSGNFITSSFYMDELPKWVQDFNKSGVAESYFKVWDTYYDIANYSESGSDLNAYERIFKGKQTATFPYDLNELKGENENFKIIADSPFGNSLVTDFALKAIDAEVLGKDDITDVLAISYSSTDKVGHDFGPNSKEIEDTYIRLDLELERLFDVLDQNIGEGQYTVFLTSDHAAPNVPAYLADNKIPSGNVNSRMHYQKIREFITNEFGDASLFESINNNQIFLNREKIKELDLDLYDVQQKIVNEFITYPNIYKAYTATTMSTIAYTEGIEYLLEKGFNQKRSGDILFVYDPAYISYGRTGTNHGSGFNYDTHAPLLFFGKGIKHGETLQKTEITDIAPTMSALLGISFPNASIGRPLEFVLE